MGLHKALAPCHGGVEGIGGARLVDDLLTVVLDRFGAHPGENLALEARELRIGEKLEDPMARLDAVADDPGGRLVKVVAVLSDEGDEDRVEGPAADQPTRVGFAAIEWANEAGCVLVVDPEDRGEFDVAPLPHRHPFGRPSGRRNGTG